MQAVENIWYYYKGQILVVFTMILLAGYFAVHFLMPQKEVQLGILFINFYDDISDTSEFTVGFCQEAGADAVQFDNQVFFDLSREKDYVNSYYQKTVAYLEAGTADAVICQYENLMGLASGGRLMNLEDERTGEIFEKYKDKLVIFEKDGRQIPVGIDVTDSPRWKEINGYQESCYLGISAYTGHFEMLEKFLIYLLPPEKAG